MSVNLFWSVYKNLEEEFLRLVNYIHCSDDQLNVYSMHIADLIIRCSIEIEAISKEMYRDLGGNMNPVDVNGNNRDLYFDTDCLDLLEQKWNLSKKKVNVSSISIYLTEEKNRILSPLHKANKRGTSGSKWKQAYQALKHDRRNSLKKANIINLLHALSALYILNLYYKDEKTDIGRVYLNDHNFDDRVGSEIFSVYTCRATGFNMAKHMDDSCIYPQIDDELLNKSIYIIKYDDKSFEEMHKNYCLDAKVTEQRFNQSPVIANFLKTHPDYINKTINEICMVAGGVNLLKSIMCFENTSREKSLRMEAVLNKHSNIYPELDEYSEE